MLQNASESALVGAGAGVWRWLGTGRGTGLYRPREKPLVLELAWALEWRGPPSSVGAQGHAVGESCTGTAETCQVLVSGKGRDLQDLARAVDQGWYDGVGKDRRRRRGHWRRIAKRWWLVLVCAGAAWWKVLKSEWSALLLAAATQSGSEVWPWQRKGGVGMSASALDGALEGERWSSALWRPSVAGQRGREGGVTESLSLRAQGTTICPSQPVFVRRAATLPKAQVPLPAPLLHSQEDAFK